MNVNWDQNTKSKVAVRQAASSGVNNMPDLMGGKQISRLDELQSLGFQNCLEEINQTARQGGLQEYYTYSRIWEYPWATFQLRPFFGCASKVLDVGSGKSPLPWFLAKQGVTVIVSDCTPAYWRIWKQARHRLGVNVQQLILDAQSLDLPTGSVDIYMSISVIEHTENKKQVISEAARVLKPGGLLLMTFDICEGSMGMSFPEWNGRAISMDEFDSMFQESPWFEGNVSELLWNTEDIAAYLSWHRETAPHHNYVTGGAMILRNGRRWDEAAWRNHLRVLRGKGRTGLRVAGWNVQQIGRNVCPESKGAAAT